MIRLSIIVPVYNVVAYLGDCVHSIVESYGALDKTNADAEIVFVDDGSDDGSGALCDRLSKPHPFLRVLHMNHAGAAASRNAALRVATGDYIGWVDSDDWVECSFFPKIVKALASGPDLLVYDLKDDRGREHPCGLSAGEVPVTNFMHDLIRDGRQRSFLCNKVFARRLFNGMWFDESLSQFSDFALMPRLVSKAKRISYIPDFLYVYRVRPGSITNSFDSIRMQERFQIALWRMKTTEPSFRKDALSCAMYQAFWICRQFWKDGKSIDSDTGWQVAAECERFVREHIFTALFDSKNGMRRKMQLLVCALGMLRPFSRIYDFARRARG